VLTLKSHLNNVLRVMFTLRDRRIMRENCYCPRPKECVYFSYMTHGNLRLGYGLAYSLTKVPKVKQVVLSIYLKKDQSISLAEYNSLIIEGEPRRICLTLKRKLFLQYLLPSSV